MLHLDTDTHASLNSSSLISLSVSFFFFFNYKATLSDRVDNVKQLHLSYLQPCSTRVLINGNVVKSVVPKLRGGTR